MSEAKISTSIKGAIGEYYVASFLSALNLVVALPRGGVPSSDLLVTKPEGGKAISLQVKTAIAPLNPSKKYTNYYAWNVAMKAKENKCEFHWYAFVDLKGWPKSGESPNIFFVPSIIVADVVTKWNDKPSTMLFFIIKEDEQERYKGLAGFESIEAALT